MNNVNLQEKTVLFASCIVIFVVVYLFNHSIAILLFALLLSNDPYTSC